MTADLARLFAFIARVDMGGTHSEPFAWGRAIFLPACPLRHDSNYLLVEHLPEGVGAAELAAEADRLLGGAGLAHRLVMLRDAPRGEALRPAFEELGWTIQRGLLMTLAGPPSRPTDTARVRPASADELHAARTAQILSYPWGSEAVARDLLGARAHLPGAVRRFAVFDDDGAPVSWTELYLDDGIGQVEDVATRPDRRGEGHASAVVVTACEAARRAGAETVFLAADADDWPWRLYERLGFVAAGRYVKFHRDPA